MLIEATGLHKAFAGRPAVRGITLAARAGEIVGVIGPNGAGKSTTLRMLAGTLTPDRGTVRVAGIDTQKEPGRARGAIGYLPEAAQGYAELTVAEFLEMAARVRIPDADAATSAITRVVARLDLRDALARPLGLLSKGWRQRAWLAQAMIHDPPVLILDEPTDGLDPTQKLSLRATLKSLAENKAVLLSTHILEEAEALCDRIVVIVGGEIAADAATTKLVDREGRLGTAYDRATTSMTAPPS